MRQITILTALVLSLSGCTGTQIPTGAPADGSSSASGDLAVVGPFDAPRGDMPFNLDTDGDGKVSLAEFKANQPPTETALTDEELQLRFDSMDTDHDGFLTASEGPRPGGPGPVPPGGPGPIALSMSLDVDGNGSISLEELKAMPGPDGQAMTETMAQDLFARLDRNQDGGITADEAAPPPPPQAAA